MLDIQPETGEEADDNNEFDGDDDDPEGGEDPL